jgi:hypothetical protein
LTRDELLFAVCVHEHGHAVVHRYLGGGNDCWVEIREAKVGELTFRGNPFNGSFFHVAIASRPLRRMVGFAGLVAETLAREPKVTTEEIHQRLADGTEALSDSDEALIGAVGEKTRLEALRSTHELVRRLMPEILTAARTEVYRHKNRAAPVGRQIAWPTNA